MIKIFRASTDWKYLQPHFCILVISTTLAALHLSLIHRTDNQEMLINGLLTWAVVGSLISEKLKITTLSSNVMSGMIGTAILAALIFRCSYLPTSRMVLHLMPFLGFLGLILVVIGWQGLRFYRLELLIFLILAINPILEILLLAGGLSELTAVVGTILLQYLGFPATHQSANIYLFNTYVQVFAPCSGAHGILQMLNISVLFVTMFLQKGMVKQIFCVGIAILLGFITNAIRVALMVILLVFSSQSAFNFWHEGQGSLIFSMIAVLLFGIICRFAFLRTTLLTSTPRGQTNG